MFLSYDNNKIVSSSRDNTINIWDLDTPNNIKTLLGHTFTVASVCFSSDNKIIVSGSWDKTIKIWNT